MKKQKPLFLFLVILLVLSSCNLNSDLDEIDSTQSVNFDSPVSTQTDSTSMFIPANHVLQLI